MVNKENAANNIIKISKFAKWMSILGMVFGLTIIFAMTVSLVTDREVIETLIKEELVEPGTPVTLNNASVLIAFGFGMASIFFGVFIFDQTRRLFNNYMTGKLFTLANAKKLRMIGWAVVLLGPVSIFSDTIGILAVTWGNSEGNTNFNIGIDEAHIYALILGLLLVTLGKILHEAAILSDEHETFI